jgi:hypothetical protein
VSYRRPPRRLSPRKKRRSSLRNPVETTAGLGIPLQEPKALRYALRQQKRVIRELESLYAVSEGAEQAELEVRLKEALLRQERMKSQSDQISRAQVKRKTLEKVGLGASLEVKKAKLQDLAKGRQGLFSLGPLAAKQLGLAEDETAAVTLVESGKKAEPEIKKVWFTHLGVFPSGEDMVEAVGGWEDYKTANLLSFPSPERERADKKTVLGLKGWSVYEVFTAQPTDREVRHEGTTMYGCGEESQRPPRLFVLPINPNFLSRYLAAVVLRFSSSPQVSQVVESAASEEEAFQALRRFPYQSAVGKITLRLSPDEARRLLLLNLKVARGDWEQRRTQHVSAEGAGGIEGEGPINFGVYTSYFGSPGTDLSIRSSFGTGNSKTVWGAQSLSLLLQYWTKAQTDPRTLPTFFRSLVMAKSGTGVLPVAVIVFGTRHTRSGYTISGGHKEVKAFKNMAALVQAMVWGNPDLPAESVCFLLPPPVVEEEKKKGKKKLEHTGVRAFEKYLREGRYSPQVDLGAVAREIPLPKEGRRLAMTEGRLGVLYEVAPLITFLQNTPAASALGFFGETPAVQSWPGLYAEMVKHGLSVKKGRAFIDAEVKAQNQTLKDYRISAAGLSVEEGFDAVAEQKRALKEDRFEPLRDSAELYIQDLTPTHAGVAHFAEVIDDGPHKGLFVPAKVVIDGQLIYDIPLAGGPREWIPPKKKQKETPEEERVRLAKAKVVSTVAQLHMETWLAGPSTVLPPMAGQVWIVNPAQAAAALKKGKKKGSVPEELEIDIGTVLRLLRTKAIPIGERERWFLVVPPIQYSVMQVDRVALPDPARPGKFIVTKMLVPTSRYSAYMQGKGSIRRIVRDLLRIDLAIKKGQPKLVPTQPFRPQSATPWSTPEVPYLLDQLPVFNKETGRKELVSPPSKGYKDAVLSTLFIPRLPAAAHAGVESYLAGAAERGKRTKKGQAQEAGRVPVRGDASFRGFYNLAKDTLQLKGLGEIEVSVDRTQILYDAIEDMWAPILAQMNARRKVQGVPLLHPATPPPIPAFYSATGRDEEDEKLEAEALSAFQALLTHEDGDVPNLGVFFADEKLIHPEKEGVVLRGAGGEPTSDFLTEDVQSEILALDNPRGGRGRRNSRKGRRNSRRNPRGRSRSRSRRNPLDSKKQWPIVQGWLGGTRPAEEAAGMFTRGPGTDEERFQAIQALFPYRAGPKSLTEEKLFAELVNYDLFPQLAPPEVEHTADGELTPFEVKIGEKVLNNEPLEENERQYLVRHANLSAAEARRIMGTRRKSKSSGRMISASGALCLRHRNTARLKGYSSQLPVTDPGSLWIVVAPPVQGSAGAARIMSFRNGSHIDCDMLVGPDKSFSHFLGKAIQGMVMWLAEKNGRRIPRMTRGLRLGMVGSPLVRVLWKPGDPESSIDPRAMLKKAYTDTPGNRELLWGAVEGVPDKKQPPSARERIKADKKDYSDAQAKAFSTFSPSSARVRVLAEGEVPSAGLARPGRTLAADLASLGAKEDEDLSGGEEDDLE